RLNPEVVDILGLPEHDARTEPGGIEEAVVQALLTLIPGRCRFRRQTNSEEHRQQDRKHRGTYMGHGSPLLVPSQRRADVPGNLPDCALLYPLRGSLVKTPPGRVVGQFETSRFLFAADSRFGLGGYLGLENPDELLILQKTVDEDYPISVAVFCQVHVKATEASELICP